MSLLGMMGNMMAATAAAPSAVSYFDPANKNSKIILSSGNMIATRSSATAAWCSALGVTGNLIDTRYLEFLINKINVKTIVGLAEAGANLNSYLGSELKSFGYHGGSGGYQATAGFTASSLGTYATGDVMRIAMRVLTGGTQATVWFGKNGVFDGDPVAGTGAVAQLPLVKNTMYPAASLFQSTDAVTLRVKTSEFSFPLAGFNSWSGQ